MIHPFFTILVSQPGLIVEHLDAYADLAKAEAGDWASTLQSRWIFRMAIVICALLTVVLGAVAGMLAAAIDWRTMPHPWILLAIPAAPAIMGLGCWWRLAAVGFRQPFTMLRDQVALDLKLMRSSASSSPSGND